MKKILTCCVAALGMLAGCKTTDAPPVDAAAPKVLEQSEQTIMDGKRLADGYMMCFLAAVRQNDFALLKPALPSGVQERDQRAHFADQMKWIGEKLGTLTEAKYVETFRKGALCEYVWKLTFAKETDGKTASLDLPYIVRTVRDPNGEVKILMVGFVVR